MYIVKEKKESDEEEKKVEEEEEQQTSIHNELKIAYLWVHNFVVQFYDNSKVT